MVDLLLAILCSTAMAIVMRMSEGRVKSKLSMLGMNYLTCLLCAWGVSGFCNPLAPAPGLSGAMKLGVVNGVCYAASLLLNQHNISTCGVILSSVFSKMGGMLIPLLAAMLLFGDLPTGFQTVGVVLSVVSVLVLNYRKSEGEARGTFRLSLFGLMLMEGLVGAMSKVYKEWGTPALESRYLLCTFAVALIAVVLLVLIRGERPGLSEIIYGFFIGLPNFLCARFVLGALEEVPAAVVYPTRNIATILLVTIVGMLFFREKLSRKQQVAVAVILVSLALLNL